ncbi:hypothetical protein [uncultured Sphingomonas sp.]|uniref:hypothetical protein n=1 Tax=uncultured Sphingomonas sp. TaxID=158754 RepID=UPI0025F583F7|nr:hypothetical protein [uncultured Sphingomonas sp.]
MPLYKYLGEEAFASALIEKGQVYFRPLSYFRAFEDDLVRGDPDDGKLRSEPAAGLKLTKQSGEVVELPTGWHFRASVRAEDIFVYYLSTELSGDLAAKFDSRFCVEIQDPIRLVGRIATHVRLRSKLDRNHVYSDKVDYRKLAAEPGADWALPERVAFIKPEAWAWQKEHRILVGRKGAFAVENVECALECETGLAPPTSGGPLIIHVGNLSKIAKLHRL